MLSNSLAASGAACVHADAPAYAAAGHAQLKRERFVAPMPAAARGTRASAIVGAGTAGNGNAGTAAAAASRDRCG